MKKLYLLILLFSNTLVLPQQPPINVKKVIWHTAEVITPIALIISSSFIPSLGKPNMNEVDEHKIAAYMNTCCGIFIIGNAFMHGYRGLVTELKPAVQEYIAQIKKRRAQKTA